MVTLNKTKLACLFVILLFPKANSHSETNKQDTSKTTNHWWWCQHCHWPHVCGSHGGKRGWSSCSPPLPPPTFWRASPLGCQYTLQSGSSWTTSSSPWIDHPGCAPEWAWSSQQLFLQVVKEVIWTVKTKKPLCSFSLGSTVKHPNLWPSTNTNLAKMVFKRGAFLCEGAYSYLIVTADIIPLCTHFSFQLLCDVYLSKQQTWCARVKLNGCYLWKFGKYC